MGPLPQELVPNTETVPEVFPKVTVMELVPVPDVITASGGTAHV
jgi:hypothetical protein